MKRLVVAAQAAGLSCLLFACSGGGDGGGGQGTGGSTGGAATGGSATGGNANTGGAATGGAGDTGGKTTATGGASTGGASTGGRGGAATGGAATGGRSGGSSGTGGAAAAGTGGSTGGAGGASTLPKFSFFVTSMKAIVAKSGNAKGFGGDLRYGETGQGAGLRGADKICAAIAEDALKGAGAKPWRAFLSAAKGEDGNQVDAIDRIGNGPWYDRTGRLFASTKADLLFDRPKGGDTAIVNDFPNEDGVPNHAPDPTQGQVDNHDMLTGTNNQGKLFAATATCLDWTSKMGDKTAEGRPHVGHSWPRNGGGMMGGGMTGGVSNMANWMSALDEAGCAPGINIVETGGPNPNANTVGDGGGYGGFYCFSLTP